MVMLLFGPLTTVSVPGNEVFEVSDCDVFRMGTREIPHDASTRPKMTARVRKSIVRCFVDIDPPEVLEI
jgi:hypothetical protein